jgi:hypothetical protein
MQKKFVKAELVPTNDEWWISPEEHPENWTFIAVQDIVPEWFDKETYEKEFRAAVCAWWNNHVMVDQKIDTLSNGYYRLKRCEVKKLIGNVCVLVDNSIVRVMCNSSTVQEMRNSSMALKMLGNSSVKQMRDESTARNFKNYPKISILVPDTPYKFEIVAHNSEGE